MDQDTENLKNFLSVLFKHQYKILTVFLTSVSIAILLSYLASPVYEAKSSLLVKFGREYISNPDIGDSKQSAPQPLIAQEEIENSEIGILTNPELIEKVVTLLKVENIYPNLTEHPPAKLSPIQAAVIKFQKNLQVEGVKKSNVIEVAFRHEDPKMAAKAVNLLVDSYKEKHLQLFSDPNSSFLETQLALYAKKLETSEAELESFKQRNQISSIDKQRSLLLEQRVGLETYHNNAQTAVSELRQRIFSLKNQLKSAGKNSASYTPTERDKIIVDARSKLLNFQLQEKELLLKYDEHNLLIINLRGQIQLVQKFLYEQEADIANKVKAGNPVYQALEKDLNLATTELVAQEAKISAYDSQLSRLDKLISTLDRAERELETLQRDKAANERNYLSFLAKAEEARISDDMNQQKMANISVINAATAPAIPIKPRKLINLLLGALLGAISGLGFAFFTEYLSPGLSTPRNAEKQLGLPVLVSVPYKQLTKSYERQLPPN